MVSAQDENPIKLSVDPLEFTPGMETVVTVSYETSVLQNGFNLDMILPEGLTVVEQDVVDEDGENTKASFLRGDALLAGHNFLYNYLKDINTYKFLVGHMGLKNLKNSGSLFSFKVKVSDELAADAKITFKNVTFPEADIFNAVFDIKKVPMNDVAFAEISDSIKVGQKYLEAATAKVKEECPDVAEQFTAQFEAVSTKIADYEKAVVAKHEAGELTADDIASVKKDLAAWEAEIDQIVAKAVEAQKNISTGINSVLNADAQAGEVYSISGMKLNKAAKGVNIIVKNGKAVKVVK